MKKMLLALAMAGWAAVASAEPPTEASVDRLLELSGARAVVDAILGPLEQNMRASLASSTQGRALTPEQQHAMDAAISKVVTVIRSEVSFDRFKPMYMKIYRESLDQSEVDGMIAFYETPAGQAVIKKMPLIAQKSMDSVRQMMGGMGPKIDAAMKEALQEVPKN